MRTIYLFFSFFILSIFSVFGSIVDVEKTHIRITSPDSLIHFHFYQRMDSDEQYHLYYSISYKDKVIIKESRMGILKGEKNGWNKYQYKIKKIAPFSICNIDFCLLLNRCYNPLPLYL